MLFFYTKPMLKAAVCVVVGLAAAFGGARLIRASEVKPGDSSFAGPLSARAGQAAAGWAALFLGLLLALVGGPMAYLAR